MSIKEKYTCPFGHACEKIVDDTIERCVLYLEMKGVDNVTEKEVSTRNCSFNWNVILQHETNARVFGVQKATESFRNEMIKPNPMLMQILHGVEHD